MKRFTALLVLLMTLTGCVVDAEIGVDGQWGFTRLYTLGATDEILSITYNGDEDNIQCTDGLVLTQNNGMLEGTIPAGLYMVPTEYDIECYSDFGTKFVGVVIVVPNVQPVLDPIPTLNINDLEPFSYQLSDTNAVEVGESYFFEHNGGLFSEINGLHLDGDGVLSSRPVIDDLSTDESHTYNIVVTTPAGSDTQSITINFFDVN